MSEVFYEYGWVLYLLQLFFMLVVGIYFWNLLKNQQTKKVSVYRESDKESLKLRQMRSICLSEPLSSLSRPAAFDDVVGQQEGIELLKAAICGPNPQHVILYGAPGIGKTAAARLVLQEACNSGQSPFKHGAAFVEVDATICRWDERNIADPLLGSVHDPIYQGAGAMGNAGIPQPKPGACTRAHGGILFIDEIGELHPLQLNKLLKVLEDRRVILESSYYNEYDRNTPGHIHDIFKNGLPADFRLIGATTRMPQELPPALRSRCMEIYFKPLNKEHIKEIARRAVAKIDYALSDEVLEEICRFAGNGREAVNMVQLAAGIAQIEERGEITRDILQKVINNGRYSPRPEYVLKPAPQVGTVNGLAVSGAGEGMMLEVEAVVQPAAKGQGSYKLSGVIEEEQMGGSDHSYRRKSMARSAADAVLTVLNHHLDLSLKDYDLHLNFPGGMPVDGPSAGIAMAAAVYSAVKGCRVDHLLAMTGELTVHGQVKAVGGVINKIEAARRAGIRRVLIPAENYGQMELNYSEIEICPVRDIDDVLKYALV
ncbi:MAG: ATP-dependent protease LonB [Syntrophomonadaceae bacterium]|nr:ATP-dependent protease LonB [Syntrophomonadaceae bacterium]